MCSVFYTMSRFEPVEPFFFPILDTSYLPCDLSFWLLTRLCYSAECTVYTLWRLCLCSSSTLPSCVVSQRWLRIAFRLGSRRNLYCHVQHPAGTATHIWHLLWHDVHPGLLLRNTIGRVWHELIMFYPEFDDITRVRVNSQVWFRLNDALCVHAVLPLFLQESLVVSACLVQQVAGHNKYTHQ